LRWGIPTFWGSDAEACPVAPAPRRAINHGRCDSRVLYFGMRLLSSRHTRFRAPQPNPTHPLQEGISISIRAAMLGRTAMRACPGPGPLRQPGERDKVRWTQCERLPVRGERNSLCDKGDPPEPGYPACLGSQRQRSVYPGMPRAFVGPSPVASCLARPLYAFPCNLLYPSASPPAGWPDPSSLGSGRGAPAHRAGPAPGPPRRPRARNEVRGLRWGRPLHGVRAEVLGRGKGLPHARGSTLSGSDRGLPGRACSSVTLGTGGITGVTIVACSCC